MRLTQNTESLKEEERLLNNKKKSSVSENSHNPSWQMQLPLACSCSWDWQIPAGQSVPRDVQSSQTEGLWSTSEAYLTALLFCACSARNTHRDFLHYLPWPSRAAWMAHVKPFVKRQLMLGVGIANSWLGWAGCRFFSNFFASVLSHHGESPSLFNLLISNGRHHCGKQGLHMMGKFDFSMRNSLWQ